MSWIGRIGRGGGRRVALAGGIALAAVLPSLALSAPGDVADLRVSKSDSPDPVTVEGVLTYTVEVANLGPQGATGVTLTDRLPGSVDFVSASPGCDLQGRRVICNLGALAANGQDSRKTVEIRVRPRRAVTIRNTAEAESVENDPQAANSEDTETTTVNPAAPPPPAAATCRGRTATVVGTGGSDQLLGTGGRDVIAAFGGDDLVIGLAGRDLICAGDGDDDINGGSAADSAYGGPGRDQLVGRGGPDLLKGNAGNDALRGNRGNDRLRGGRGSDLCRGGAGFDSLRSCER